MSANISTDNLPGEPISRLLSLIGQPARIQILLVIGKEAACVSHLEAVLGMRQASISQHLMVLRKAGLVAAHWDGSNIFYHLCHPEVVDVLQRAALLAGIGLERLEVLIHRPIPGCPCSQCNPEMNQALTCQKLNTGLYQPKAGQKSKLKSAIRR